MAADGAWAAGLRRVLAVAPFTDYNGFNTSIQRIRSMRRLGLDVRELDTTLPRADAAYRLRHWLFRQGLPVPLPDALGNNRRLVAAADEGRFDILWIDKGLTLQADALAQFRRRQPGCRIIGFSPDDMAARHNQSRQFLGHLGWYDLFFTTKSYNVAELEKLGCPKAEFIGNGYDPEAFRPLPVTAEDAARLGGEVGFIGTYEAQRAGAMRGLAEAGVPVRIWGDGWHAVRQPPARMVIEHRPLYGGDYARACGTFKINLCFLRKANRDLQTTRSVEIPACGGFMLAERTDEHLELFKEGEEAAFFGSGEELLDKCRYYLKNDGERRRIAENGRARCISGGYSNESRMRYMLARIAATSPRRQA